MYFWRYVYIAFENILTEIDWNKNISLFILTHFILMNSLSEQLIALKFLWDFQLWTQRMLAV